MTHLTPLPSIIVDTLDPMGGVHAARPPRFPPKPPGAQCYFRCADIGDDGFENCHYMVVANDLEHAKQILRLSEIEFGDPSVPFDQAHLAWTELKYERAAEIRCNNSEIDGTIRPLNTFEPGDWFSSEW